jgi:hypothetical protein
MVVLFRKHILLTYTSIMTLKVNNTQTNVTNKETVVAIERFERKYNLRIIHLDSDWHRCIWSSEPICTYITFCWIRQSFYTTLISYLYSKRKQFLCITLSRNESGRFGALKSDSTHHFFRNTCTKSRSLRFS